MAIDFNLENILYNIFTICITVVWPLHFCAFASSATERISIIRYSVYDLDWYDLPPELQKYLILIIAQAQEELYFTGFHFIRCTLGNFGVVNIQSLFDFSNISFF